MLVYISTMLSSLVAILHCLFAYKQIVIWRTPAGLTLLGVNLTHAGPFKMLALQQGVYNLFLALGLILSLCSSAPQVSHWGSLFFLSCMCIAGIIGGLTAFRAILFVQALPAAVALLVLILKNQIPM